MNPSNTNIAKMSEAKKSQLIQKNRTQHCVLYLTDNGSFHTREKTTGAIPSCRVYHMLIVTILFSTLVICACVYAATSVIEQNVLSELMSYQKELEMEREQRQQLEQAHRVNKTHADSLKGVPSVVKRSADRQHRHRRRRGRRGRRGRGRRGRGGRGRGRELNLNQESQKSAVHMQISSGLHITDNSRDLDVDGNYFVWAKGEPENYFENFEYVQHDVRHPNDVLGIKIKHTGLYEVYSQVIVKGVYPPPLFAYYCAQEMVQIRNNRRHKVLLKGFVTQPEFYLHGDRHHAYDSVYQFGVFFLESNDEVRVGVCDNTRYMAANSDDINHRDTTYREGFYFGVIQR